MKAVKYDELSPPERTLIRDAYIIEQHGLCYLCMCPLTGPPPIEISRTISHHPLYRIFARGSFNYHTQLHHSHHGADKGYTLGVVHAVCNAWLYLIAGE